MSGFFNMDGPFYRIGGLIADVFILSFLWFFFSLPFFTIGASTTALFYVTTRRISNNEGYLMRDFWKSFKGNFRQATIIWLMIVVVAFVLILNMININVVGNMKMVILPFQICFFVELILISMYVFPVTARFQMGMKDLLKTAFFMANKHILTSILCLLTGAAVLVGIYMVPILFIAGMGIFAFATSYFFMRIFKKYRPELDAGHDYVTDSNDH